MCMSTYTAYNILYKIFYCVPQYDLCTQTINNVSKGNSFKIHFPSLPSYIPSQTTKYKVVINVKKKMAYYNYYLYLVSCLYKHAYIIYWNNIFHWNI